MRRRPTLHANHLLPALLLGLACALALSGCLPVQRLGQRLGQRPLDRQLRRIVDDPAAPLAGLAVVVVADKRIIYEGYFGDRYIDAEQPARSLPVTAATKFRVASLAKVVTALGAMRLVEEGKIDLDADISRYLGFPLRNPAYPQRPITMRMLLSHTSSLRDGGLYNLPPPHALRELFVPGGAYYDGGAHFAPPQQGADQGPGAYFTYANLNYGVLGTIVEAVSGERFDRYMQEHVLAPLGIDGGYTIGSLSAGGFAELAAIYSKQSPQGLWDAAGPWYPQLDSYAGVFPHPQPPVGGQPHLGPAPAKVSGSQAAPVDMRRYMPGANATLFAPHAGLRISARDLAKFLLLLLDEGRYGGEQMLARDAVRRMLQEEWRYDPQQANGDTGHGRYRAWGLGLQHTVGAWDELGGDRLAAGEPRQFWGHRGEAYGFLGGMWFDPQSGIGFVYLSNGLGDDPYQHWGQYSSAYAWEEAIQTAILDEIARWEAAQQ